MNKTVTIIGYKYRYHNKRKNPCLVEPAGERMIEFSLRLPDLSDIMKFRNKKMNFSENT